MNCNIYILLNNHVAISIFAETDDRSNNCVAINVLHKKVDNAIDFIYDEIIELERTEIIFRYENEIDLFSNLNKVLDFAEHISSNIFI